MHKKQQKLNTKLLNCVRVYLSVFVLTFCGPSERQVQGLSHSVAFVVVVELHSLQL